MRSRAERYLDTDSRGEGPFVDARRGCYILERRPRAVEHDDFLTRAPARLLARHDFAELGVYLLAGHSARVDRGGQVPTRDCLVEYVHDHGVMSKDRPFDLLLVLVVRRHSG